MNSVSPNFCTDYSLTCNLCVFFIGESLCTWCSLCLVCGVVINICVYMAGYSTEIILKGTRPLRAWLLFCQIYWDSMYIQYNLPVLTVQLKFWQIRRIVKSHHCGYRMCPSPKKVSLCPFAQLTLNHWSSLCLQGVYDKHLWDRG